MCVYNELSKRAIVKTEYYLYNSTQGFLQKNSSEPYLYTQIRKPLIDLVFSVQEGIKPQLSVIKEDESLNGFYLYHKERLEKLRKIQRKYDLSTSEEKRGEILEEEKKLLNQVIRRALLRSEFINDQFEEIKPGPTGQTALMEVYFKSIYDNLQIWQKQEQICSIFDPYAEDFVIIDNYEKKLEECKYYKGFNFCSMGTWKFTIKGNNGHNIFSHESPMLCLYQKEKNEYYPYEYMAVCVDFEMESGGASEEEAYESLENSFNIYFDDIFEENNNLETNIQSIETEKDTKNIWKDTFNELIGIGKKQNVRIKDHKYSWKQGAGVSID
ncbi:MAG: hypothetical protein LBQ94_02485 [Treponema sp.]|nr:hypothetical protein [Treponema sp.]